MILERQKLNCTLALACVLSMSVGAPVWCQESDTEGAQTIEQAVDEAQAASDSPEGETTTEEEPAQSGDSAEANDAAEAENTDADESDADDATEEDATDEDATADESPADESPAADNGPGAGEPEQAASDQAENEDRLPAEATPDSDATTSTAASADPAVRANYDRVFREWKELLTELVDLQNNYLRVAEDEELETIKEEYDAKIVLARGKAVELREAALAAYLAAPTKDIKITQFLYTLVQDDLQTERYNDAYRLSKHIIENHAPDRVIYLMGTVAAIGAHEFEIAKEWSAKSDLAETDERSENPYVNKLARSVKEYLPTFDELKILWEQEQKTRAAEAAADDLPRVELQTSKGTIVLELFENEAPDTVGSFIYLVEKKFYDGLPFHRVLPGFMAQGGCPRGDGTGGPGYMIYCECVNSDRRNHFTGSLSMAKGEERNTGGSQFFLTFMPTPHLNGDHTVFGRVIDGMDVLQSLQVRDPNDEKEAAYIPDVIKRATVLRKRDHVYVPKKVE